MAAIEEIEENVVRGFDGLSNEFRFETLLSMYACLAGKPYTYQNIVGSIAKKQEVVENPAKGNWRCIHLYIIYIIHVDIPNRNPIEVQNMDS